MKRDLESSLKLYKCLQFSFFLKIFRQMKKIVQRCQDLFTHVRFLGNFQNLTFCNLFYEDL